MHAQSSVFSAASESLASNCFLIFHQMEPKRAIYRERGSFSPYQNLNRTNAHGRKKYVIRAPRPGLKADVFPGIQALNQVKKATAISKRIMLEDVPILNQSRDNKRVIRPAPPKQVVSTVNTGAGVVLDNVGATQEVVTEKEDIVTQLEKRKMYFGVSCSECSLPLYSRMQLCVHITSAHGIPAPVIHKDFDKEEDFREWMNVVKETHAVDFVHSSGSRKYAVKEQKIMYLQCSRSGDPKRVPGSAFKQPRRTVKCGKTCLAYLKVTQELRNGQPWGPLKVEGCLQHSGHTIDPQRLQLTPEEERAILQLIERSKRTVDTPIDINMARAILNPCARFRLIEDDHLLMILPKWFWQVANEQRVREERWNELDELDVEREEERDLAQQSISIHDSFRTINQQMLDFDSSDDLISVV